MTSDKGSVEVTMDDDCVVLFISPNDDVGTHICLKPAEADLVAHNLRQHAEMLRQQERNGVGVTSNPDR